MLTREDPDPRHAPPPRVHIYLDRDEAEALLPILHVHRGKGALRYVHERVRRALEPPAYRWAVPSVHAAAADAFREVEDWMASASTHGAARDALHRLGAALQRDGVAIATSATAWRGGTIALLNHAGFHVAGDREFRLLLDTDPDVWHPSGATPQDVVAEYVASRGLRLGSPGPRGRVAKGGAPPA